MLRFRRVGTAFVAGVYFLTNVMATHAVEKSLWEERRAARDRAPQYVSLCSPAQEPRLWESNIFDGGSSTSQPPSIFQNLAVPFDVASAVLPYGAIGEVRLGRPGSPVVFLVQDVHGNDGAQKNIGGLLGELSAHGVTLTGVEGAWVPFDLSSYHRHPSPPSVSLVADALRSAGRLSGSEWAGLTAPHPPTLVGVESPDLYRANVAAALSCVSRRPATTSFLLGLDKTLQSHKERIYSPALKTFDLHRSDYRAGREGLAAFARYLSALPGATAQAGAQVKIFLKAIAWESRLNFDAIEADRHALMDRLSRDLGQSDLDALLSHAVAFRAGKQTNGDFFSYLKFLCAKSTLPLSSYRSFADYITYVGLVQSIRRVDLLNELNVWETVLGSRLAKTPEEKSVLDLDRDATFLRQLLENEMSPDAWAQFTQRRNDIVSLPARLRKLGAFQEPQEGLAAFFHPHEEFCRLAMERNGALVANFVRQVETQKAHRAVLVTGGFHTPGLQSALLKRGYSTVVLTPRIDKVEGKPLDVFARDPLPFDQMFAGKPISLSPELMMGNPRGRSFFDLLVFAERLSLNPASQQRINFPGVESISSLKSGGVRLILSNGGGVLAGPSNAVAQNHIPSETFVLSNGHAISVFRPTRGLGRWKGIINKGSILLRQVLLSIAEFFHRSIHPSDGNKFGISPRRLIFMLFPLPSIAKMTILPIGSRGSVEVWTSYWSLGVRSMTGRSGYNSAIDGFFESFFRKMDPKARLLDVGGGAGYLGNLALKISPDFSVVELDSAHVPEKSRFQGLHYLRAYAENIPFPNSAFDGVVDAYSLAYTDTPKAIDELFRVLKPGGKAAILLHSPDSDLVNTSKNKRDALVRHGWDESVLMKIEEYLKRTTPANRKKELISDFVRLYNEIIEGNPEEKGGLVTMAGPLDILANILFASADRAPALVELYRVSFLVWHDLFKAAGQMPTNKDDVSRLFTHAGFVVDRLDVSYHDGFSQGWAIELSKPNSPGAKEIGNAKWADSSNANVFGFDRTGLAIKAILTNSSGKSVGSAIVGGKRGAIDISHISIEPGENSYAKDVLVGALKEFLLLKGQGRVLLRGVKDRRVKQAAILLFGDNVLLAPKGFGRSLSKGAWADAVAPGSSRFLDLLNDPKIEVDMAGSLTPEARKALWPNEALPPLETGEWAPDPSLPEFVPSQDIKLIFENGEQGLRENNIYDVRIDGRKVGTAIFSETLKDVWLRDISINAEERGRGYGTAVYRALAERAALILNPNLNSRGDPVPFEGRNLENPLAARLRSGFYVKGTREAVAVGTKASDEYFDPVENWDGAVEEGSSEFDDLVGEKNIETFGPNGGFYRQHFNVRGLLRPEIMEQAERTFLREQNRLLRPNHMPSNGFALMGVGVPFDPLMGLALATVVLLAMVFKEKLLNWLEGRAPPKMYAFVNKFVPALQIPWGAAHRFAEKVTRSPWIVPLSLHIVPDPSMGRALRPQEPWRPESTVSMTDVVRGANDKSHLIFSKKGIGYLLSARNSQGQEIGKAAFFGKRGEVTVTDVESPSEGKEILLALLIDVARAGLFEGGEGRLLIRGTNKTGVVEAALSLFEPDSLLLAPHRFDRDVKNDRWNDQLPRDKFATFVGEMGRFNKFADVSGRLSADVRRNLWATDRVFRDALEMEGKGFREVSLDSTSKMFDVRDTQGNVVGRAICSLSPTTLTLKWIDSNTKGVGWGKSTLLALAMESSRILLPQRNRKGHPVPLVVENIKDARTTHLLMKYILKPGTAEACPANADVPLAGFGAPVNWDQAFSENDPRFDPLVHSSAGSESPLFHLRGELRNYIYDLAASRYRERSLAGDGLWPIGEPRFKNNLYFLPLGIPIDPVWGGSLLLLFVGVLLYRDVLLEWVGSKLTLSRLMNWVKNISKKSSLQSTPLLAETTPERSSLKALSLSEEEASLFALEIAHDLKLGSMHSETVERGKILYRVEYDAGARFERVGSLFYVSADLWQEQQDYFRNKMGAYLPNLIVLPLETYNMPRHSFLSSHAALLVTKMMGMDLDGKTVIDLGCGQGTLTLTALKLGAKRVVGIDQFPWGNGDLFKAQGVRLGRVEDDPASYDILIVRGRIQKKAPPNLIPHIEGASVLVANVGPNYDVYYEMVPAWSTFPSLEVWLDGGHFSNAVLSGSADFIAHAPGWEVREVFGGLINGDSSQGAPAAFLAQRISNPEAVDPLRPILSHDQGDSHGSGETSLEKVFNPNFSVGPGIRVSRRPVNDTLDPRDRQRFAEALGNLLSGAFKMQGVEAMIDPHRLGSGERSGDRLAGMLHLPGGSPWAVPEGMLEGVLRQDSEWILRTRLFASRKLGSQALAKRVVSAAENGDATGAGVALAAWDDSQFLAGPSPDIVAEIMALLTQTNTLSHGGRRQGQGPPAHLSGDPTPVSGYSATRPTSSDGATSAFAKAYNQARSGLLFPKLLGGHLAGPRTAPSMGPGVVLNVSALFDETAPDQLKGQTWLALSSALVPFERDPNFPLALVVFGKKNTRAHVENILSRNLPRAVTEALTSALFVEGGAGSATFFNEGKFSLLALQGRPQWQRDVKVLGFTEETLLKGAKWSVELIPLDATRMPDLQRILKSLQFIKQSA